MSEFLQKLVLKGKAESRTLSCYGANFYALEIPSKQTIVVTQIDWFPFVNIPDVSNTIRDLMRFNQYQLKLADDKSSNFLHFVNDFNLTSLDNSGSTTVNDTFASAEKYLILTGGAMRSIPCYLVYQQELRIALTKLDPTIDPNTVTTTLAPSSKEQKAPQGIKDLNQTVKISSTVVNYVPPVYPNNSPVDKDLGGNNNDGYYVGVSGVGSEFIYPPQALPPYLRGITSPLFTLHYYIIKENLIGLID